MGLEVQAIVVGRLLIFLALVLLVRHVGLQLAVAYVEAVVPHRLVMFHVLEGQGLRVGLHIGGGTFQLACLGVALALDDARGEVVITQGQTALAPCPHHAEHAFDGLLAKL